MYVGPEGEDAAVPRIFGRGDPKAEVLLVRCFAEGVKGLIDFRSTGSNLEIGKEGRVGHSEMDVAEAE